MSDPLEVVSLEPPLRWSTTPQGNVQLQFYLLSGWLTISRADTLVGWQTTFNDSRVLGVGLPPKVWSCRPPPHSQWDGRPYPWWWSDRLSHPSLGERIVGKLFTLLLYIYIIFFFVKRITWQDSHH